jgi:hypothetical protein
MSRNLIEEAKTVLNEAEQYTPNAIDLKSLKTVLTEFEIEDDFEDIKKALSQNSNRSLRNFVFGICEELFTDRTTLKRLGKGFRGE